jgi:mono/diheme cytochrome c family protein
VGPPLAGPAVELSAQEVRDAIRHGVSDPTSGFPAMVPVRGLSREQIEAVAAYVTNENQEIGPDG